MTMRLPPEMQLRSFVLRMLVLTSLGVSLCHAQPANDLFVNRTVLTGTNIATVAMNVGATREAGEPYVAGSSGGASVWWSWTAPTNGIVTISTAGSSFDTVLGVFNGSSILSLTEVASNDDDSTAQALTSNVTFPGASNQTYQIVVDGYGGASGIIKLWIQIAPPAPPPPAPAWLLPDPYGVVVDSSSFAGKVLILDFWATWCGPCKAGMPDLVELQDKYGADGLAVIGADTGWSGDTASVVQDFLAAWTPAINYQIIMANNAMMQAYGGINAIPTTFIIDRHNIIRKRYVGTQSFATLERAICPLLFDTLTCRIDGSQMALCWNTNAGACTLESATKLVNPDWSDSPATATEANGINTVTIPTTGSARYFRLRMAY